MERLIQLGADVNVLESPETSIDETMSFTALHNAAWHGNLEAVEALLRNGADTRIRDSRYTSTPAGWAHYAGQNADLRATARRRSRYLRCDLLRSSRTD